MEKIELLSEKYNVSESVVSKALENLKNKKAVFLCVSGKIGAGKDTAAPLVLEKLGYTNSVHLSFADTLKEEVNVVIEIIQNVETIEQAYSLVRKVLNTEFGDEVVLALWDEVKGGIVKTSKDRTLKSRKALQLWGTEVRRSVDEDYWVKITIHDALQRLAEGQSVYVTDSRFPNEAKSIIEFGGTVVRLLVSPEVQSKRIFDRDGTKVTYEARNHASEIALDNFEFDNIVNTDDLTKDQVVDRIVSLIK